MPTNLPTYSELLERVKAQEWGHEFPDNAYAPCPCRRCGEDISNETNFCPPQVAQAIQAAMVDALRIASRMPCGICYSAVCTHSTYLREAADALEKE